MAHQAHYTSRVEITFDDNLDPEAAWAAWKALAAEQNITPEHPFPWDTVEWIDAERKAILCQETTRPQTEW